MNDEKSPETNTPKLHEFPTDILQKIFVNVDPIHILKSLRLVSKKFFAVSSNTKLWKDICQRDWLLKESDLQSPAFERLPWMSEWQTMYQHWKTISSNSFDVDEKSQNITITADGNMKYVPLVVSSLASDSSNSFSSLNKSAEGPIQAKQSFFPLPFGRGNIGYFEVTITSGSPSLVVGAAQRGYDKQVPGWAPHSVGFCTANGTVFQESVNPRDFGDACKPGDVIGCGVCFDRAELFFTRNGQLVGGMPLLCSAKSLVPTLGFLQGSSEMTFKVNFGAEPFKFDLIEHQKLLDRLDRIDKSPSAVIPYSTRVQNLQQAESEQKTQDKDSSISSLPDIKSGTLSLDDFHRAILECQAMIHVLENTQKYPTSQVHSKMRLIAKQNFSGEIDPDQNPDKLRQELHDAYVHLSQTLCQLVIEKIVEEYKQKAERPINDEHLVLERLVHQISLVLDKTIPSSHPVMIYHLNQLKDTLCEQLDIPSLKNESDPEALRHKIISHFLFSTYMTIRQRKARLAERSKAVALNSLTLSEHFNNTNKTNNNIKPKKKRRYELLKEEELKKPRILEKQALEKDLKILTDTTKSDNDPAVVGALWRCINAHGFEHNIPFGPLDKMRQLAIEQLKQDKEELFFYEHYKFLYTLKRHIIVLRNKDYLFDNDTVVQEIIKLWKPFAEESGVHIFASESPRDELVKFLEEQLKQTEGFLKTLLKIKHQHQTNKSHHKSKRTTSSGNQQNENSENDNTLNKNSDGPNLFVPTFILGAAVITGYFVIRSIFKNE